MQIPESRVARTLHDEHLETLTCLGQLESQLTRFRPDQPPDGDDRQFSTVLGRLHALLKSDLDAHFRFEEDDLFPLLNDAGEDGIVFLLTEEHETIRPIGQRLTELAGLAREEGLTGETWKELRLTGLELCERLQSHIQKEEMGLLPLVDSLIDEEQDSDLCELYLSKR